MNPVFTSALFFGITLPTISAERTISFNDDVRPILSENCYFCHGPDAGDIQGDLQLHTFEAATKDGAIVPGDVEGSEIWHRINSDDPDEIMPQPKAKIGKLSADQIETIKLWIEQGAEFEKHWAFEAPVETEGATIDSLITKELTAQGIEPAPEVAPGKWLRRVTFDLTGLPPSLEELDQFISAVSASGETAYSEAVDRLLANDAYGEQMATGWLDAARYADTFGYQADQDMNMWPWRDWVIRAFNSNLSYDKFLTYQLAGDMLENPTDDQVLATAFNRLHRQTNEGGSVNEEFRVEYVSDRVHTVGTAMLGLTMECSRCHDHKYDPISQKDYYAMTAYFDNIDESGLYSHFTKTAPTPAMPLWKPGQEAEWIGLKARIAAQEAVVASLEIAADEIAEKPFVPSPVLRHSTDGKKLDGDAPVTIKEDGAAAFDRTSRFTIGATVTSEEHRPRAVVLHRSRAAEDSAFRGYELVLDNGIPTVSLVHFWPGNAIRVKATEAVSIGKPVHIAFSYDGSSKAGGVNLYVDGKPVETETVRDKLTRDITHKKEWGDLDIDKIHLQLGARFRDIGLRNGVVDDVVVFNSLLNPAQVEALASGAPLPPIAITPELVAAVNRLHELRTTENNLVTGMREIMVMKEEPEQRQTYLLARGAYDAKSDPVEPALPEAVAEDADGEYTKDRLGFAKWVVSDENPLTARVAVNRAWQILFGRGLVGTPEDFGSQGEKPHYPAVLDTLAVRFRDSGSDLKALFKTIALSKTYRQSSKPRDIKFLIDDPNNILLARGPRHRLPAEQIRDNVLAVSGLLVDTQGGESVFPYQPAGLWKEAGTGKTYSQSKGDGLYRRSLYTFIRRTAPPPSMSAFDGTTREVCTVKREVTADPQQALVLLNDPQFVEASRVFAEKLVSLPVEERVKKAFRTLTSREPDGRELRILTDLYEEQLAHFRSNPESAKEFIATGEMPVSQSTDPAELAATAVLVTALFSFEETITKR